jgi:hypothetical protein
LPNVIDPLARSDVSVHQGEMPAFSTRMVNVGFAAGLLMAFGCLFLSAVYLNNFLTSTNTAVATLLAEKPASEADAAILRTAINARLVTARLALQSCGVFVGMGFGFIGFALFLVGARGETGVDVSYGGGQAAFTRLAPGVLVILCAAMLIGICATRSTPFVSTLEQQLSDEPPESQRQLPPVPGPANPR